MIRLLRFPLWHLLVLGWLALPRHSAAQDRRRAASPRPAPATRCDYHLRWDGKSSRLGVQLDYTAVSADSTVFVFAPEHLGGQADIFQVLENLRPGPTDRLRVVPAQQKIVVLHTRAGRHTLHYVLNGAIAGPRQKSTPRELFRPVIMPGSLYLTSAFFLLQPQDCPPAASSLQFDQFPAGVGYFLSAAPRATPGSRQLLQPGRQQFWTMVLGTDIVRREYRVHNIPYYSLTSRRDTVNRMSQELAPFFTRFFPTLRTFWHDDQDAYYYLCVLPTYNTEPTAGGFGWGPGFIMKYSGPFDNWAKLIVAHETSHSWIGSQLTLGENSFANQWFGEGFNDYVCLINLAASGIFDSQTFLEYLNNRTLRPHYTSAIRSAPNDSIAPNYWRNTAYQRLPYRRGLLYAFYLDNQVRLASHNQYTLRDVLLALRTRARALQAKDPNANLSVDDFIETAGRFMPREQVAHDVAVHMLQGQPLDFHHFPLIPAFRVTFDGEVPVLGLTGTTPLSAIYSW